MEYYFELLRKDGFARVRINGEVRDLDEDIDLDKNIKHTIEVIVDRVKVKEESRSRLYNSLETSCKLGDGKVLVSIDGNEMIFSEHLACPHCDFSIPKLEPSLFSFNAPFGACDECKGLGFLQQISIDLLVPDDTKTIRQSEQGIKKLFAGFKKLIPKKSKQPYQCLLVTLLKILAMVWGQSNFKKI